jgi:hypothetical protein
MIYPSYPGFCMVIRLAGKLYRVALEVPPLPEGAKIVKVPLLPPEHWAYPRIQVAPKLDE